jgi:hypothetical protein
VQLAELDSRSSLGSDVNRMVSQAWQRECARPVLREVSALSAASVELRQVRVIVARLGPCVRVSAPALDIVADGRSFEGAWRSFLDCVSKRSDSPWLAFDVGKTRRDEIADGLDADADEIWAQPDAPEDA